MLQSLEVTESDSQSVFGHVCFVLWVLESLGAVVAPQPGVLAAELAERQQLLFLHPLCTWVPSLPTSSNSSVSVASS